MSLNGGHSGQVVASSSYHTLFKTAEQNAFVLERGNIDTPVYVNDRMTLKADDGKCHVMPDAAASSRAIAEKGKTYEGVILSTDDKTVIQQTPSDPVKHERALLKGMPSLQQGAKVTIQYLYDRVGIVTAGTHQKQTLATKGIGYR